jgi:hypothetical protein
MKNLICFVFLSFPLIMFGQKGMYCGFSISSGYYQLYNKNDWHSEPYGLYIIKPDLSKFNNYQFSGIIGKSYSDKFSGELILSYRHLKQDYKIQQSYGSRPIDWRYWSSHLQYASIAPNAIFYFFNQKKSEIKPCLFIKGGVHILYLLNYSENAEINSSYVKYHSNMTISDGHFTNMIETSSSINTISADVQSIYNKFQFGLNCEIGGKIDLTPTTQIRVGINGFYDLTNAENLDAEIDFENYPPMPFYQNSKLPVYSENSRPMTHNIYFGINFSLIIYLQNQNSFRLGF